MMGFILIALGIILILFAFGMDIVQLKEIFVVILHIVLAIALFAVLFTACDFLFNID